jgi:hypothetical protein
MTRYYVKIAGHCHCEERYFCDHRKLLPADAYAATLTLVAQSGTLAKMEVVETVRRSSHVDNSGNPFPETRVAIGRLVPALRSLRLSRIVWSRSRPVDHFKGHAAPYHLRFQIGGMRLPIRRTADLKPGFFTQL